MNSILISTDVLNTINSLPESERSAIASALTDEFILGNTNCDCLSSAQKMIYTIIRFYVRRDSRKYIKTVPNNL